MAFFTRKSKPATQVAPSPSLPPGATGDLESAISRIGSDMLARARAHKSGLLSAKFYNDALMEWSMKDQNFKVQLFRFVDCFPVLKTPEAVFDHLDDYLSQPGVTVPGVIAAALKAGKLAKGLAAGQISKQITGMAEKFILGVDAASALPNLRDLWNDGIAFSVDLLGEACLSDAEADAYRDKYLDLIGNLPAQVASWPANPRLESDHLGPIPRTNVSVKISSLSARCDPIDSAGAMRDLMKRLKPILELAKTKGVFVNFDMEQFAFKDFTLDLFMRCCEEIDFHAGLAMQAYLKSGEDDARRICEWSHKKGRTVTVRLVKGAYWDYEVINAEQRGWPVPVWPNKRLTDACFERMVDIYLDATPKSAGTHGVKLALGSHNVRSIAAALAGLERRGLPPAALELQMLHGMADQLKHAAADMGLRIREYAPVGQMIPGMAYLVRRLLENTSNESWLKAGFLDNADPAKLLASPHETVNGSRVRPGAGIGLEGGGKSPGTNPEKHKLSPAVEGVGDGKAFFNESFRDFARADQHAAFKSAVAAAKVERVENTTTPQQAAEMVARAHAAFPAWRDTDPLLRSKVLVRAAALMRQQRDQLSAIMIKESGKTWREADADTCEAIDFCEFYARTSPQLFTRSRIGRFIGELDESIYQPKGVAVVISPWNFPLAICCGMTVAALVTGNTVIVKPAEQTPAIAEAMHAIIVQSLNDVLSSDTSDTSVAPSLRRSVADLIHFCPAPGESTGAALVRDPRVALIAFTGSRDVGLDILNAAAPPSPFNSPSQRVGGDGAGGRAAFAAPSHLKHVVCEMGGKNALIIDTSADHDEAILAARHSAFGFQGQKCSACSRLIVVDPQGPTGPAFTHVAQRLVEAMKALTIGDPSEPGTDVGPVIDAEAGDKIRGFIDRAKASGVRSESLDLPSSNPFVASSLRRFVAPTIFFPVPENHELATEEIFGPVLAIIHAPTFDDALRIANSAAYKLTGGVFTRKPSHIEKAKREFRVGNLYINRGITGALVARQPFGGFGMSGGGTKAGGLDYLLHFVDPRAICENTMRRGFAPEL